MARNNDRDRSKKRGAPKDKGRQSRPKVCIFCKDRIAHVDYKDVALLRKFINDRGKIRARQPTGNCAQHQRDVAIAIKTARELVLLPYTQRTTMSDRPAGRGSRRGRDEQRVGEARPAVSTNVDDAAIEVEPVGDDFAEVNEPVSG